MPVSEKPLYIDIKEAGTAEPLVQLLQRYPQIQAVVITGFGGVSEAVAAMKRGAIDFDSSQAVRKFGLEPAGQPDDAGARGVRELVSAFGGDRSLSSPLVEATARHGLAALVVDHGVPKDPIEPPDHRVPDLVTPVEAAHEGLLDDLLRDGAVAHTALDVAEELPVVLHQLTDDVLGFGGKGRR